MSTRYPLPKRQFLPPLYFLILLNSVVQYTIAQNIGIGIMTPQARLDVAGTNAWDLQNSEGDVRIGNASHRLKIGVALLGGGAGGAGIMQFGQTGGYNALSLGSQGNYLLSIFGEPKTVEIANIAGGKVGIGITPTITDGVLEINGRSRIRSGGNLSTSAGIWLNNSNNSAQSAFIGMEDDNHVGLFGASGAGWKFMMNTQNGALKINGSEGAAGQVIKSNGAGNPPDWASVSSWLYNNMFELRQTGAVVDVATDFTSTNIPGMGVGDLSVIVNSPSKLLLIGNISFFPLYCFACGSSYGSYSTQIYRNGVYVTFGGGGILSVPNDQKSTGSSGVSMIDVTPGVYTFNTYVQKFAGNTIRVEGGHIFIAVIPQ